MNKVWFTSDTHFDHANIIKYENRPFENVKEMNDALISYWNETVAPNDVVWHLGDFCLGNTNADDILIKLNGEKHLIWGNHDSRRDIKAVGWKSSQAYKEMRLGEKTLCLFHYGMRVWNKCHYGSLHLYGHSHGSLPGDNQSLDVGVDCWNYRPIDLKQIMERMATLPARKPVDHHGE